jgi:hypothetical protein
VYREKRPHERLRRNSWRNIGLSPVIGAGRIVSVIAVFAKFPVSSDSARCFISEVDMPKNLFICATALWLGLHGTSTILGVFRITS